MNWKIDLKLANLDATTRFYITCKRRRPSADRYAGAPVVNERWASRRQIRAGLG
jgi:hypothetical protein